MDRVTNLISFFNIIAKPTEDPVNPIKEEPIIEHGESQRIQLCTTCIVNEILELEAGKTPVPALRALQWRNLALCQCADVRLLMDWRLEMRVNDRVQSKESCSYNKVMLCER